MRLKHDIGQNSKKNIRIFELRKVYRNSQIHKFFYFFSEHNRKRLLILIKIFMKFDTCTGWAKWNPRERIRGEWHSSYFHGNNLGAPHFNPFPRYSPRLLSPNLLVPLFLWFGLTKDRHRAIDTEPAASLLGSNRRRHGGLARRLAHHPPRLLQQHLPVSVPKPGTRPSRYDCSLVGVSQWSLSCHILMPSSLRWKSRPVQQFKYASENSKLMDPSVKNIGRLHIARTIIKEKSKSHHWGNRSAQRHLLWDLEDGRGADVEEEIGHRQEVRLLVLLIFLCAKSFTLAQIRTTQTRTTAIPVNWWQSSIIFFSLNAQYSKKKIFPDDYLSVKNSGFSGLLGDMYNNTIDASLEDFNYRADRIRSFYTTCPVDYTTVGIPLKDGWMARRQWKRIGNTVVNSLARWWTENQSIIIIAPNDLNLCALIFRRRCQSLKPSSSIDAWF